MISEAVIKEARILIVDDEPAVVDVLVRFLSKAGYTNVRSASDPDQALLASQELEPDLVILDLQMPRKDGFWLLERLHEDLPEQTFLPIIVLTGDGSMEQRRRALAAGAQDILVKPVDYIELMLRISHLLEIRCSFIELIEDKRLLEDQVRQVAAGA